MFRLTYLTFRTVVRSPARHYGFSNESPARDTRLVFARINSVPVLKGTSSTLGVNVVRDGRTARIDGFAENFIDHFNEPLRARPADVSRCRLYARAEERFVRVDVSYPAEH